MGLSLIFKEGKQGGLLSTWDPRKKTKILLPLHPAPSRFWLQDQLLSEVGGRRAGLGWAGFHDHQPVRSDEVGMVAPTCDPSTLEAWGLDSGKEGLQALVYDGSGLD